MADVMGQGFIVNWRGDEAFAEVMESLADSVQTVGDKIVERAKELSPVDTGRHRDSIEGEQFILEDAVIFEISTHSGYGLFLEYGTMYMAAQPHIRPALESVGPTQAVAEEMKRRLPSGD